MVRGRAIPAVLSVVLFIGCTGRTASDAEPSRGPLGGTLRIGIASPVYFAMDPAHEFDSSTWEIFRCCLVRTLMSYDVSGDSPDIRPVPDLAAAPPAISLDGLTWTFRLREGIRYAPPLEDAEVTSGDFVRALTRAAHTSPDDLAGYLRIIEGWNRYAAGDASSIVGVRTPDPHTLVIVTTRPDASLLNLLALPMTAPIPPMPGDPSAEYGVATGLEREPFDPFDEGGYGRYLVASGPYMIEGADAIDFTEPVADRTPASGFEPWTHAEDPEEGLITDSYGSITMVRNPSWEPGEDPLRSALADRIEIAGGQEQNLFHDMEAGTLDLVMDAPPPPGLLRRYQDDPDLRPLIQSPSGAAGIDLAVFNVAQPPFDDPAVRRAVAAAIDRTAFVEARIEEGAFRARVAEHFSSDTFQSSLLAGWSGIPGSGHGDVAAARAIMDGSRYATGGRCDDPACGGVRVVVSDAQPGAAAPLRRALGALGIDARVSTGNPYACLDPETHIGMCAGLGWVPDYPSADAYIRPFFHSESPVGATRLGSPEADLRRWGYAVLEVPSVDERIERCAADATATQAWCWARLDQYLVAELSPAIPLSFLDILRVSSPVIGPFPWDQAMQQPALERIVPPAG